MSVVNFILYQFNSMYTVKYDKLPLVLCCIWYQVCRFRDYEKSGTIFTQEIMRHSSSIHNQFKSYTSGGNYSILSHLILPLNRLSPFFFFLLLCHTGYNSSVRSRALEVGQSEVTNNFLICGLTSLYFPVWPVGPVLKTTCSQLSVEHKNQSIPSQHH